MHRTAEFVLIGQYLRNCCPLIQAQHLYYWETFFLDPRGFVSLFKSFIFLLFLALLFKILRSPARLRLSFFLYLFGFPFKPSIHPVSIKPLITILKFLFLALSKPINTGLKTQVEFCANNPLYHLFSSGYKRVLQCLASQHLLALSGPHASCLGGKKVNVADNLTEEIRWLR